MHDASSTETHTANNFDRQASPSSDKAGKANARQERPLADEEIGDYTDRNAIQVDGGDNSFLANLPCSAPTAL